MESNFDFDDNLPKSLESDKLEAIEGLAQPLPEQGLECFVSVGLFGERNNPHCLKDHKHVPTTMVMKVFGKFSDCIGRYKNYHDHVLREKIEKIWTTCYSKDQMPRSKIISTQFGLGIVVE